MGHARAVLASGSDDATALAQAAFVLHAIGDDSPTARSTLDRAIVLNPNSAQVIAYSAVVSADLGDAMKQRSKRPDASIRLSPFDPMLFRAEMALTVAYYYSGRFADAADAAMRAIRSNPRSPRADAYLAASCHQLGRIADARTAVERLLEVEPSFRVNVLRRRTFGAATDMEGLFAALRAAGLLMQSNRPPQRGLFAGTMRSVLGQSRCLSDVGMSASPPTSGCMTAGNEPTLWANNNYVRSKKIHHSITSSARAKSVGGIVNPSALAVFRLMTSSTLVLCWIAGSARLAPLEFST